MLESLIEATYTRLRGSHLARANLGIEKLRFLLRLAQDRATWTGAVTSTRRAAWTRPGARSAPGARPIVPTKQRDLFDGIASFSALHAAALRAAKGKRAKPGAAAFLTPNTVLCPPRRSVTAWCTTPSARCASRSSTGGSFTTATPTASARERTARWHATRCFTQEPARFFRSHPIHGELWCTQAMVFQPESSRLIAERDGRPADTERLASTMANRMIMEDGTLISVEECRMWFKLVCDLETPYALGRGEVIILDNMLTAHGRSTFTGSRGLFAALGDRPGTAHAGAAGGGEAEAWCGIESQGRLRTRQGRSQYGAFEVVDLQPG